jgi:hypothetical protein
VAETQYSYSGRVVLDRQQVPGAIRGFAVTVGKNGPRRFR